MSRCPPSASLCQEFGVARTSVREAIQGLVIAGYVERRGNRSVVAERLPEVNFTGDDRKALVTQLFEVRQVIEPAIAEMAARRATDEQRAEIAEIAATNTKQLEEFRELDHQFHAALARSCGNPLLHEVHSKALASLFGSGDLASLLYAEVNRAEVNEIIASSLAAHRAIAEAVVARPHPQGGRRGGGPPRRRRAPDGGAAPVSETTTNEPGGAFVNQYCYFFDDDAFVEEDRPGLPQAGRARRRARAVVLAHRRRHRRLGAAQPRRQRADRDHHARRARLPDQRRPRRPVAARSCSAGDVYLANKSIWHGDSNFIGDDELNEVWILDVFAPPRTKKGSN